MRATLLVSLLAGLLSSGAAVACQSDLDCSGGGKCLKDFGAFYGICYGGMRPGNDGDRRPGPQENDPNHTSHLRFLGRAIDHMEPMRPYMVGMPRPSSPENYWGLVQLIKVMPPEVSLGQEFAYDLRVTALQNIGNVVVTDRVPAGAVYVRSEPTAQVSGDLLQWRFNEMDAGAIKISKCGYAPKKKAKFIPARPSLLIIASALEQWSDARCSRWTKPARPPRC